MTKFISRMLAEGLCLTNLFKLRNTTFFKKKKPHLAKELVP